MTRDIRLAAENLLSDYDLCCSSRPKHNAIDVQIEKDTCSVWANHLKNYLAWGNDNEISEAYYQLEHRLNKLKEKIIIEVLTYGI
jgi:DNA-directed RNA polymerase subunit L